MLAALSRGEWNAPYRPFIPGTEFSNPGFRAMPSLDETVGMGGDNAVNTPAGFGKDPIGGNLPETDGPHSLNPAAAAAAATAPAALGGDSDPADTPAALAARLASLDSQAAPAAPAAAPAGSLAPDQFPALFLELNAALSAQAGSSYELDADLEAEIERLAARTNSYKSASSAAPAAPAQHARIESARVGTMGLDLESDLAALRRLSGGNRAAEDVPASALLDVSARNAALGRVSSDATAGGGIVMEIGRAHV